jgi:hypothetical protein
MSDVALRKKKNADAQAAFRARRANYIATLEETGSIVLVHQGKFDIYFTSYSNQPGVRCFTAAGFMQGGTYRGHRSAAG